MTHGKSGRPVSRANWAAAAPHAVPQTYRQAVRPCCAGAVLALCLVAVTAAPAGAAVVDLTDNVLSVRDPSGEDNVLDVRPSGFGAYEVHDAGPPLEATGSCTPVEPQLVTCLGLALRVHVEAGDGDDLVGLWDDFRVPVELSGGAGDDALAGGPGNDDLQGGEGDDSLTGGPGNDRSAGEQGADHLGGGEDADTLLGGDGDDIVDGEAGAGDVLLGQAGRDLLLGGPGADQLQGGADDDALAGGAGADAMGTGEGADEVFTRGADTVDCRAGDELRGDAPATGPGCGAAGPGLPLPDVWPPPGDPAPAVASAISLEPGGVVVRRGDARHFWIWVASAPGTRYAVDATFRLRGGGRRLYKHCYRLWTNEKMTRDVPPGARAARKVRGKVHRGRRCR